MMVRLFKWSAQDVYSYFNMDHPSYPNLPPPPNPVGLQLFMMACVDVTIEQMQAENDPKQKPRQQASISELEGFAGQSRRRV